MRTLSRREAQRVYDRIGTAQDWNAFYEDPPVRDLLRHSRLQTALRVFEFGCGTGRLAATLLAEHLPANATYLATDLSSTMVELARRRTARFGSRVEIHRVNGDIEFDLPGRSLDRVISTYVLDLLPEADIHRFLEEAHRVLVPNGCLCLAGLAPAPNWRAALVLAIWQGLYRLDPRLVGGCRPVDLLGHLEALRWRVMYARRTTAFGIPSEVVVAQPALYPESEVD